MFPNAQMGGVQGRQPFPPQGQIDPAIIAALLQGGRPGMGMGAGSGMGVPSPAMFGPADMIQPPPNSLLETMLGGGLPVEPMFAQAQTPGMPGVGMAPPGMAPPSQPSPDLMTLFQQLMAARQRGQPPGMAGGMPGGGMTAPGGY